MARGYRQQRVAVGLFSGDIFSGNVAACPGLVFDHYSLFEPLSELDPNNAYHHIGTSARRDRQNDHDRPIGISGLSGSRWYQSGRADQGEGADNGKFS